MKLSPFLAAATVTLVVTLATDASQGAAQEEVLMPEVNVRGQPALHPHHPQDPTYSSPPIGCAEVVTPSAPVAGFAFANAARAKEGTPVIPDLNNPSSASDFGRRRAYEQHPATPPGREGKPGCGL
ncbi:MAG TPA: hypothetical protein VHP37_17800 [Burkholderiales bacterium]|nr:hypothetical protein [Burkholderiales bacterium]